MCTRKRSIAAAVFPCSSFCFPNTKLSSLFLNFSNQVTYKIVRIRNRTLTIFSLHLKSIIEICTSGQYCISSTLRLSCEYNYFFKEHTYNSWWQIVPSSIKAESQLPKETPNAD